MKLTEQQKHCPYCHDHDGNQRPLFVERDVYGLTYFYVNKIEKPDGVIVNREPNFCEQCGRSLNEEETND